MEITTIPRRSGRALRTLVNLFCIVTMLGAIVLIVPAAFGLQRYVITGTSMSGTVELGSVVFAEVVPVSDLRVGDVITYMPPPESGIDHLVTHRIVSIKGDVFRTKGDAVPQVDPWTFQLADTSQARVKYDVPYLGYAFIALQDRSLRMLLIGLPAGLIALISLFQLVGAFRRRPEPASPTPAPASKPRVTVSG